MDELERQLATTADVWRPVVEEALEHGLRVVDGFKVDRKDKAAREARRERGDRIDEVLDELEAIREAHYEIHKGPGKLLPEEDVPELARLIRAVRAVTPGEGTAADLDVATELGELVSDAMLKRGGPKLPEGARSAGARGGAAASAARDPVAEDRERAIERLEQQKAEAVAGERYEEAGELKAQIAEQRLLLVERRREMADESERAEVNKRYSGQKVVEIFKYRWDQTDQYVRVYVDIPCGVDQSAGAVECEFPPDPEHPEDKGKHQSFVLRARGVDGRQYCLKRKVLRPIDPHEFGEINTSTIRGVTYGGCRVLVEDKRVIVHMTKYFMIVTDEERAEYRQMAEDGMMGPMAQGMMGSRENEDRTSAGMWDTLELPAYSQQPKKIYHRDDDGNPIPPKKSVLDTEPEPEPEPESAGGDGDGDGLLQKGAAVIVSGLVSAAHHNGKSGRVLRYDRKKERYAVQLLNADGGDMDGERLLVKPSCLLEDLDAIDDEAAAAAEQQQQQEPPPTPAEPEPMAPPPVVGSKGAGGSEGKVGHRYVADYDRFERLAAQQNDLDEDLMEIMHKMYVNGDVAKKKELEASYKKATRKLGSAKGPY